MKRILVTGGAGFIGSHLVDKLLARGDEVAILDDFSSGSPRNLAGAAAATLVKGSLDDLPRVAAELGAFDVIYHLAALISGYDSLNDPQDYLRVNVDGVLKVIDFAQATGAKRIILASSSTVYGATAEPVRSEGDVPEPITVYALSKLAGERLLAMYAPLRGYTHTSLRLFNVYGPRQNPDHPYANVTCKFAHAAATGGSVDLYGDGEQSRDFVYIDDVIDAFLAIEDGSRQMIYNVGTGRDTAIKTLLSTVEGLAGAEVPRRQHGPWPNDIRAIRADVGRISEEFGFKARVGLEAGLRATMDYFAADAAREA